MKWIMGTVAAALIAYGIYHFQNQSPETQNTSATNITDFVPADTIYYFGAHAKESLAQFMADYYLGGTPGGQAKLLHLASEFTEEADTPAKAFVSFLIEKFQKEHDGTMASVYEFFGLSATNDVAIYSHGLMPVLKLPLKHPKQLNALIDEATQVSGLAHRSAEIGGKTVRLWEFDDANNDSLSLALLVDANYATFTFLRDSDPADVQKERLGLSKPTRSLSDSKELLELNKKYNYSGDYTGFIHFERIVSAFTAPENSLLGREIESLTTQHKPADALTPDCATEYMSLARSVPRLVLGYQTLTITDNVLNIGFSTTLEITNNKVTEELAKMRGHISQHAQQTDDKIFSIAYGVDLDKLTPALTALWIDFTQQPFQCESLLELQQQAKQSNPIILSMVLAMAQGIKGIALSIYDLEFAQGLMPSSASALISIAAENPAAVTALASMAPLPELAQLQIPSDGTAVAIDLPMLPPAMELKAAIKGQHLVIYAGKQAEQAAQSLAAETLEANGIFGVSANYTKIANLIKNIDTTLMPMFGGNVDGCAAQMEFLDSLSSVSGSFYMQMDHTQKGWQMEIDGEMNKPMAVSHKIDGQYTTEYLDDSCQWQVLGVEQFNKDGSGQLKERDANGECDLYVEDHQWTQMGGRLNITAQKESEREACSDDLVTQTQANIQICFITQSTKDQFVCHFNPETDESAMIRYSRAP